MDINQIIAQASQPHVTAIEAALAALKTAADAAKTAGFKVALRYAEPAEGVNQHPDASYHLSAVSDVVLRDEVNVELTYSVSILSKAPEAAAPAPTVQPAA